MIGRVALAFVAVAAALMLVTSLVAGRWAAILFALLAAAFPPALMLLGSEGRRANPARWPILALLVVLELGMVGMLVLRGRLVESPWLFGLPAAAAIQVYGLLFAPLALVALGYAWTFDAFQPSPDDVERLRTVAGRERRK